MGHLINPLSFRLGLTSFWKFNNVNYFLKTRERHIIFFFDSVLFKFLKWYVRSNWYSNFFKSRFLKYRLFYKKIGFFVSKKLIKRRKRKRRLIKIRFDKFYLKKDYILYAALSQINLFFNVCFLFKDSAWSFAEQVFYDKSFYKDIFYLRNRKSKSKAIEKKYFKISLVVYFFFFFFFLLKRFGI